MAGQLLKEIPQKPEVQEPIPITYRKMDLLPSRFKVYPELYIRKLTVFEMKQLAASNGSLDDLERIIGAAIKPIPFRELALGDLRYVLALLKSTTFKNSFWTASNLKCPHCGFVNSKVIYDRDLQFEDLDPDVNLPATYSTQDQEITINDVFRVKHQIFLESLYKNNHLTEISDNSLDILAILMIPPQEYIELESKNKLAEKVIENYNMLTQLDGEIVFELDEFVDIIYFDVDQNFTHKCKGPDCGKEFGFQLKVGKVEDFFPENQPRVNIREKVRFGVQESK